MLFKQKGMTLLEVIIALVIFATITTFTAQSLRQALTNKAKIQTQLDELSQVRDALSLIKKDITLAGHYLDVEKDFLDSAKKIALKGLNPATPSPTQPPAFGAAPPVASPEVNAQQLQQRQNIETRFQINLQNRQSPETHFLGQEEKIYFITTHQVLAPQVEPPDRDSENQNYSLIPHFIKVHYRLDNCPMDSLKKCLIRFSSLQTGGDIEKIENGFVILTNVTELKFKFLGRGQQDWISTWDSRVAGSTQFQKYPDAVQIKVTVEKDEGKNKKQVTMQATSFLHFANNPVPANAPGGFR